MVLIGIYTHDLIQKAVEQETALLAARRGEQMKDGTIISQFENLVFDEAYHILFRRLFNDARAEVVKFIPARYLEGTPTDLTPEFREFPDFRKGRDFELYLKMSEDFLPQYRISIDSKIELFLIDYICYRWFETKLPREAQSYFVRLEATKADILKLLGKRTRGYKRLPSFP